MMPDSDPRDGFFYLPLTPMIYATKGSTFLPFRVDLFSEGRRHLFITFISTEIISQEQHNLLLICFFAVQFPGPKEKLMPQLVKVFLLRLQKSFRLQLLNL